jgi:hypothetical protein
MRAPLCLVLALCACTPKPPDVFEAQAAPTTPPDQQSPTNAAKAFENQGGMWLPTQLEALGPELEKLGLAIPPSALADPMAYPLGAVVSLGGCSASFVSAEGLVVTNHHCVTGALQYNATPEQNLLETGYLAKTRADEKWAGPTARVYVTQSFKDVTDTVRKGLSEIPDPKARYLELEKRQKALIAECEKTPNVRCDLASYFGEGQFLLIQKLEIRDVRLVYAPHQGIGNYGGEIDNWRWPRHSGDFSFLRAYVGRDGKPADHAADNVPYSPRMHLQLADKPLAAGDLVMVAGYPGQTFRLKTAEETREATEWFYPKRVKMFEDYLALIEKQKTDKDIAIKARPLERSLANALTYTRGTIEGLTKGGSARAQETRESKLRRAIDADPKKKQKYGQIFEELGRIFEEREKTREVGFALFELQRVVSLLRSSIVIARMAEERPKADRERNPEYQERNWSRLSQGEEAMQKRYARKLDSALLELALTRISKLEDVNARSKILAPFLGKAEPTAENIQKAVTQLYAKTGIEDEKTRVKLLKTGTIAQLKASRDPMVQLGLALLPLVHEDEDRSHASDGALLLVRPLYVQALREQSDKPLAPDANGTLRVTYGTVRGYKPNPGAPVYEPFTKLPQVAKKATGTAPFDAPEKLVKLAKANQGGPYVDKKLGTVPVDFLADLDITGGNSGSPTLDAHGKLVGLAFDGNYEAMSSDWVFLPPITRSIHVDIRYVMFVMDAVDGADHLLTEMGVKPAMD